MARLDEPYFDGITYDHDRDGERLGDQMRAVSDYMLVIHRGDWVTLRAISYSVGAPEASVSARLRDLRKERFGSIIVERRYVGNGLHEYRVPMPVEPRQLALVSG